MHIVIAGSMSALEKMQRVAHELEALGHEVDLPSSDESEQALEEAGVSAGERKQQLDLIRGHYRKILRGDVLLVVNPEKRGIPGYVGGNAFLEMGFAYVQEKPIYVLEPIGELAYSDEIDAMEPIVLDGDLSIFDA